MSSRAKKIRLVSRLVKATCAGLHSLILLGVKRGSRFLKHYKTIWQESRF